MEDRRGQSRENLARRETENLELEQQKGEYGVLGTGCKAAGNSGRLVEDALGY
jgi:hypothetical protein